MSKNNSTIKNANKNQCICKSIDGGACSMNFGKTKDLCFHKKNTVKEAWEKLTGPQLKEAIEMFRTERDSVNEHLSFDEYQRVVDVHALAEWIEWEYTEVLMLRQQWENTMRAEAEYEAKLDKKYGDGGIING